MMYEKITANVDVFVQVWYLKPIQPEQTMVKDTMLIISYYSLIDILPMEEKQNNELQPKLSTSRHNCTNTIVMGSTGSSKLDL